MILLIENLKRSKATQTSKKHPLTLRHITNKNIFTNHKYQFLHCINSREKKTLAQIIQLESTNVLGILYSSIKSLEASLLASPCTRTLDSVLKPGTTEADEDITC